jgi:hypothetical protein
VRANAATAHAAREDAAFAARDGDAFATLFADDVEAVDHPNGATYGRREHVTSMRRMLSAQDLTRRHESLATLGDALALCRMSLSAGGIARGKFDVGSYESERVTLFEVDAGRCRRIEFFASDHLGDAIARLYERYAEFLPDGPAQARAAATARSVAAMLEPSDVDRHGAALAPAAEFVDHRMLGTGSKRGAQGILRAIAATNDLEENRTTRIDDILELRSDALLVRRTSFGTGRASGGAFERQFLQLVVFGSGGLLTRIEYFDADRDVEALARFDELTAGAKPAPRRVRPNAATANHAALVEAIAARDADAIAMRIPEDYELIDHPTGATYGRSGQLHHYRRLLRTPDLARTDEPLATLGDSLALCHSSWSGSGAAGRTFDVGAFDVDKIQLLEVDAQGRGRRTEVFATDHLGDSIARLYERYAELLPDGPARVRAAATARSVAATLGPRDVDRDAAALAPGVEGVDHRTLGYGTWRGAEAILRGTVVQLELEENRTARIDDVLDLQSDALLVRRTHSGTARASGGAFERSFLLLIVVGADGLVSRWEQFDVDRVADALARFDELTAGPKPAPRRVRPNAAMANLARADAAFADRDVDALRALFAADLEAVDHTTGTSWDAEGLLATWRSLMSAREPTLRRVPLATLGDSLALSRLLTSARAFAGSSFDVGADEREELSLIEVDAQGLRRRSEYFASDHLGDAIARMHERYADLLPEGPEQIRAAATARSIATLVRFGFSYPERLRTALAPDLEGEDRRTVGVGSTRGAEAFLRGAEALGQLSEGLTFRIDDILDLRSSLGLVRLTISGTDRASGGAFERLYLLVLAFGADGLVSRWEQFDVDRVAEALARFDELVAGPKLVPRRVRPNAATAHVAQLDTAVAARDVDAFAMTFAEDYELIDHTTGAGYGRSEALDINRRQLRTPDLAQSAEPLATLGDSLALCRLSVSGSGAGGRTFDVGAFEIDKISLVEVDAQGRRRRVEMFATNHLGDAVARLYERYAELLPEGPERVRAAVTARAVAGTSGLDFATQLHLDASLLAPDIEFIDHRPLGLGSSRGAEQYLRGSVAQRDLAENLAVDVHEILDLLPDASLLSSTTSGTLRAGGGTFERPLLSLSIFAADGRLARRELFDPGEQAAALTRFDELTAEPANLRQVRRRVQANAATASNARYDAAIAARDEAALDDVFADGAESVHHATGAVYDRGAAIARSRAMFRAENLRFETRPLAALGHSLALGRSVMSADGISSGSFDVGAYEIETILLTEVGAQGRRVRAEWFEVARLGDAVVRLYERYAELLPDGPERARAGGNARVAAAWLGPWSLERYAAALKPDIEVIDHRILGTSSARGAEAHMRSLLSWLDVADDITRRVDEIFALRSDALLAHWTHLGTDRASGGAYERPYLLYWAVGDDGLVSRWEYFDPERVAEALARFDELAAEPPTTRFANAASRAFQQTRRAIEQRDWDALVALYVPEHVLDDRRSLVRTRVEGEAYFANLRRMFHALREMSIQLLATRGDRLALFRQKLISVSGDAGPAEFEFLNVCEVDATGRRVALVTFDLSDLDAAYAELDERYAAGEAAPYARMWEAAQRIVRLVAARDWDQSTAVFADDFIEEDHRLLGWGTRSGDEFLAQLRVMVELAPDVTLRLDHYLAINHRGVLRIARWVGSRDGGPFEIPIVSVILPGPDGRIRRLHAYDLDQLDAARARFAELRPDPLRIPPNAATRASDRQREALEAEEWEAVEDSFAPTIVFEDRRRGFLTSGDREMLLANDRELSSFRPRFSRTVLATAGDRLVLQHLLLAGTHEGGAIEGEFLQIVEIDGDGRLVAVIAFDPDDRRAASREMLDRWACSDASHGLPVGVRRAILDRDVDRLRAELPDGFVFHDHRRTGAGRLAATDDYVAWNAALVEASPDAIMEVLYYVAVERHAFLALAHNFGTLADGGAFESVFVVIAGSDRTELFEPEDLDLARARFEELSASGARSEP